MKLAAATPERRLSVVLWRAGRAERKTDMRQLETFAGLVGRVAFETTVDFLWAVHRVVN